MDSVLHPVFSRLGTLTKGPKDRPSHIRELQWYDSIRIYLERGDMAHCECIQTEESLEQVNRVCRRICTVIKIIFVIFCIFWIIAAASIAWSLANEGLFNGSGNNIFNLALHVARGVIVVALCLIMIRMLEDTVRGESPFTMKQAGRLRNAAFMLVIYAVLGIVLGYCSALLQMNGFSSGYVSTEGSSNVIMTIDFAPFIAAAVVFAFSFVFKYGVLLQELSDETL